VGHAVIETDPVKLPPDHGALKPNNDPRADLRPDAPAKPAELGAPPVVMPFSDAKQLEAKPITIDLMMLYTKRAESLSLRIERLLALSVEQVNETSATAASARVILEQAERVSTFK
jgi:hypothetical protein